MNTKLKDGLQVFVALLFTGSTAFAMQPPVANTVVDTNAAVERKIENPKPVKKPHQKPSKASEKKKAVSWRDNPNRCSRDEWIAKEKPFECIPKTTNQSVAPATTKSAPVSAPSGSCADWIAAAGISDVGNANELIRRESGCNPNAVNASSGACGVAQELPCGKSGCGLGNGACQVKWMNSYVLGRYGSWAAAVSFHDANNWY